MPKAFDNIGQHCMSESKQTRLPLRIAQSKFFGFRGCFGDFIQFAQIASLAL